MRKAHEYFTCYYFIIITSIGYYVVHTIFGDALIEFLAIIIIICFGDTVSVSHLTKCNTNSFDVAILDNGNLSHLLFMSSL